MYRRKHLCRGTLIVFALWGSFVGVVVVVVAEWKRSSPQHTNSPSFLLSLLTHTASPAATNALFTWEKPSYIQRAEIVEVFHPAVSWRDLKTCLLWSEGALTEGDRGGTLCPLKGKVYPYTCTKLYIIVFLLHVLSILVSDLQLKKHYLVNAVSVLVR